MDTTQIIMTVNGAIAAIIFSISSYIAFRVWRWNVEQKQKDRALEMFTKLMSSDFGVKARLTSCTYLVPGHSAEKYKSLEGLNYEEIDVELQKAQVIKDAVVGADDRFYIRAIPNFFQAVNLAHRHGFIADKELIFSEIYSWYWVNVMEERCVGLEKNEMFTEHKWMRRDEDIEKARQQKLDAQRRLTQQKKSSNLMDRSGGSAAS